MLSFKELRTATRMTTKQIAKKLDIKVTTYRKYECCVRLPNAFILTKMPEIFNCTSDKVVQAYNNARRVQIERYGKTNP